MMARSGQSFFLISCFARLINVAMFLFTAPILMQKFHDKLIRRKGMRLIKINYTTFLFFLVVGISYAINLFTMKCNFIVWFGSPAYN